MGFDPSEARDSNGKWSGGGGSGSGGHANPKHAAAAHARVQAHADRVKGHVDAAKSLVAHFQHGHQVGTHAHRALSNTTHLHRAAFVVGTAAGALVGHANKPKKKGA